MGVQPMRVDVIASQPHYFDHLLPIFRALPMDLRGEIHPPREPVEPPRARGRAALVASWIDVHDLQGRCPMIYVEHGSGQAYSGDAQTAHLPGYSASAGERHVGVVAYISPNETVAKRWRKPAVAVGCPKLDRYFPMEASCVPTVCFVWHWPCTISPEARTAWPHYVAELPEIVERYQQQGFEVFGHAHPRWFGDIDEPMRQAGMTVLATDADVFEKRPIVIVDNSSLGTEAMALGLPAVWMNAPWYRRNINHGGRFWDWATDVMDVDGPEDLLRLNLWDVQYSDAHRRVADEVYAYRDGTSSARAAAFIDSIVREM